MIKNRTIVPEIDSDHFLNALDMGMAKMEYFKEKDGSASFEMFKSGVTEYARANRLSKQESAAISTRYESLMNLVYSRTPKVVRYVEYHEEEYLTKVQVQGVLLAAAAYAPLVEGRMTVAFDNQLFEIADSIEEKEKIGDST